MTYERKKINYVNGVAIKRGVSQEEANGTKLVYPKKLSKKKSLLHKKGVVNKGDGSFNIHMKILKPLHKIEEWKKQRLEYTPGAIKMLERQFKRLHSERPHTDFNVKSVIGLSAPLRKEKEYQKFQSLVRQILVEQNSNGKVIKMYLSDFDIQNTGKTQKERINLEKKLVNQFKDFITTKVNHSDLQNSGSATRQLMFNSPGKRVRNNITYQTPPQSPRRKLFWNI